VRDGGTLVIENGTFNGNITAIYVHDGTLEVKGGTFDIQQLPSPEGDYRFMLNCLDANYGNGTAKIIVKGGRFHNFDPGNNLAEGPGTNFLAPGYKSVQDGEWFEVVPDSPEAVNAAMEINKTEDEQAYDIDDLTENADFIIPTGTTSQTITFHLDDIDASVTGITIRDEDVTAGYVNNVIIEVADGVTVPTITVNAPNAHVTLKQGTYSEIIASTSGSTLEIGDGVIVNGPLTVNSGNILIKSGGNLKATASKITNNTGGTLTITVEQGGKCSATSGLVDKDIVVIAEVDGLPNSANAWSYKLMADQTRLRVAFGTFASGNTVFDFNGHTVTINDDMFGIKTRNKVSLTVKGTNGGKLVSTKSYGLWQDSSGVMNIYDIDVEALTHAVYAYSGTINIYGGTFKLLDESPDLDTNGRCKFLLNCYDANYTAGKAGINVFGGKFYNYNPAESYSEPNGPVSFVAEGYHVVQNGDWYEVVPDGE
jgi:hypothetical protein